MDIQTRYRVIEWFDRNRNTNEVLRELDEDPIELAARLFRVTYNQAKVCERESNNRFHGVRAYV